MLQEMFKDAKGEIRNSISKKERQHNGQKIKGKRTNNDRQNTTQKTRLSNMNPTKMVVN